MSKGTKKVVGVVIIIVLILLVSWLVYRGTKSEQANINETNTMQSEDMKISNEVNEIIEENNVVEEEVAIPEEDNNEEEAVKTTEEEEKPKQSSTSNSEVVAGTNADREKRAVELAKKYYENEYGSTEGLNFEVDDIDGAGRYIVKYGTPDRSMYLYVNLSTETVSEK